MPGTEIHWPPFRTTQRLACEHVAKIGPLSLLSGTRANGGLPPRSPASSLLDSHSSINHVKRKDFPTTMVFATESMLNAARLIIQNPSDLELLASTNIVTTQQVNE